MKNLKEIAENSARGTKIYYSFAEDTVYTEEGKGRFFVTELIRPNAEDEIKFAIKRWMSM